MKIGFNKVIGITFLAFTLFNCCLATIYVRMDEAAPNGIVAGFWISLLVGILFLTRSYIEVTQNELIVKSLIGTLSQRINVSSVKDLSIENGKVFVASNGVHQKLKVYSWLADKHGWDNLIKWVETGNISV